MAALIDIEDVLTHAQLNTYVGGMLAAQQHLLQAEWDETGSGGDTSTGLRVWALDEVLAVLANRTPPVYESDVTLPAELMRATRHKAAERIYDVAMSSGTTSELWYTKMRAEERRFSVAMSQLQPTVTTGVVGPPATVGITRR